MVTCSFCSLELRDQFNLKKHHTSNHQCSLRGGLEVAPPPPLHNGKLGPVNDLMDLSNKVCPTETQKFLLENHITKEAYHGEHCDMVMDKIEKLEEIYPDEHKFIIDGFNATKMVNKSLCGRVLKENWKESLASFEENILFLH